MGNNYKVVLENTGDEVNITGENVSIVELAAMLGYYAGFVVMEATKRGMGTDEIKDSMLDIFLAATANLN